MCTKSFYQNVRNLTSTACLLSKQNHYDALGVTPKATHAQVKSAYYKLSMLYHPDKNEGSEEAAKQFRNITAAYEVLGNVKMRRLYDKGLYGHESIRHEVYEDKSMKFYRSREKMTRPPMPGDGRTPIYDFDEWSRQHYGTLFAQKMRAKASRAKEERSQQARINDAKIERMVGIVFVFVLFGCYFFEKDYDRVEVGNRDSGGRF